MSFPKFKLSKTKCIDCPAATPATLRQTSEDARSFPKFKLSNSRDSPLIAATVATLRQTEEQKAYEPAKFAENEPEQGLQLFATNAEFAKNEPEQDQKSRKVATVAGLEPRHFDFEGREEGLNAADSAPLAPSRPPLNCRKVATVAGVQSRHFDFSLSSDPAADRIEAWLCVADMPQPRHERELWERYTNATIEFATGLWAPRAIECGWSDGAIFSIAIGLVPEWCRRSQPIKSIGRLGAVFSDGERSPLTNERPDLCPVWWCDPRFSKGVEYSKYEGIPWWSKATIQRAPEPIKVKPSRPTMCGSCLFAEKGHCAWYELPLAPDTTLCGDSHWEGAAATAFVKTAEGWLPREADIGIPASELVTNETPALNMDDWEIKDEE